MKPSDPKPATVDASSSILAGRRLTLGTPQPVTNPFTGETVGVFDAASPERIPEIIKAATADHPLLPRHRRHRLLNDIADLLDSRRGDAAALITAESGLCLHDTRHEVERALAVLRLAAIACLQDEARVYPDDIMPGGRNRRIYTQREPFSLILAITPFNHPLNQVVHKLAPAFATNNRVILKPSNHTPLTAWWFADLCLEAGLPPEWISVVCGANHRFPRALATHDAIEVVTFTGGTAAGRDLAHNAGYKKLILELGGSSPLIVLPDADLEMAVEIAANGCFRNSGQRCTAIRRLLLPENRAADFTDRLSQKAANWSVGNPVDSDSAMGTVIDEDAARHIEGRVEDAIHNGARLHTGHRREGALYPPTVLDRIRNDSLLVREETFGPLAPVITYQGLDEAIAMANDTAFGLSSAVIGQNWQQIQRVITGVRAGTVNVNAEPGWRLEWSPFGGIKASGLGEKEGVLEAMRGMTWIKSYSLPWDRP